MKELEATPREVAESVEILLTPDGDPPSCPYFWRDWDILDDGAAKKSVLLGFLYLNTTDLGNLLFLGPMPEWLCLVYIW